MIILLIDDDNKILTELKAIIELEIPDNNILILETTNGKHALEISNHMSIDIFVIDIDLPDINGIDLSQKIRKLYKCNPIIIESKTTNNNYKASIHNAIHNIAYLTKPINKLDFKESIMAAIRLSKKINNNLIQLEKNGSIYVYEINEIVYAEKLKNQNKIAIAYQYTNLDLQSEIFNISLTTLINKINSKKLIQIHRSFAINVLYIKKIDFINKCIILKNSNTMLPIGTTFMDSLRFL